MRSLWRWIGCGAVLLGTLLGGGRAEAEFLSVGLGADPRVFNFNEQGQLTSFDLFTAPVQGLAFDRFGDRLVLLGNVGSVGTVVGLPSGLITLPGNLQVGASIAANAASPFGGFSIALGADPRVFNFNQQGQLTGFDLLQAPVQGLAYDRFGNRLVLMGNVGSVGTVVGLPNIGPITLPGNLQVGASIAANPFGGFSVALGADPRVFNFNEQGQLTSFDLFTAPVQGLAFDRFGDRLVLLGNVGSVGTVVGLPSGLITLPGNLQVGASIAANPVPEPSSIALCGLGLMGVLVLGRRRRPRSEIRTRVFL